MHVHHDVDFHVDLDALSTPEHDILEHVDLHGSDHLVHDHVDFDHLDLHNEYVDHHDLDVHDLHHVDIQHDLDQHLHDDHEYEYDDQYVVYDFDQLVHDDDQHEYHHDDVDQHHDDVNDYHHVHVHHDVGRGPAPVPRFGGPESDVRVLRERDALRPLPRPAQSYGRSDGVQRDHGSRRGDLWHGHLLGLGRREHASRPDQRLVCDGGRDRCAGFVQLRDDPGYGLSHVPLLDLYDDGLSRDCGPDGRQHECATQCVQRELRDGGDGLLGRRTPVEHRRVDRQHNSFCATGSGG